MIVVSQDGRFFTDSDRVDYWEVWPLRPEPSAGGYHIKVQVTGRDYYNLTLGHFRRLDDAVAELSRLAHMVAADSEMIYRVRQDENQGERTL